MITLSNADSVLKDYYLDVVNAQLNSDVSPFYSAIVKTSANVFGKDVKMAIAKGGMSGVSAGGEGGRVALSPFQQVLFGNASP